MDEECDLDCLVNLFWNYIRLGQWELACATLQLVDGISNGHREKLLVAVALYPDKYRFRLYYI